MMIQKNRAIILNQLSWNEKNKKKVKRGNT